MAVFLILCTTSIGRPIQSKLESQSRLYELLVMRDLRIVQRSLKKKNRDFRWLHSCCCRAALIAAMSFLFSPLLLSSIFLATSVVVSADAIIGLDATADNYIFSGAENFNYGAASTLHVGSNNNGLWRGIVHFNLSSIALTSPSRPLLTATLVLHTVDTFLDYIPCTADNPAICATVHIVNTPWGEGKGFASPTTTGESSWTRSGFPTEWQKPGGDFQERITLGRREPETSFDEFAVFSLDVNVLQPILDDPDRLDFGFLIRNDGNPGRARFHSRDYSVTNAPPRLDLEFASAPSPTVSPTNRPAETVEASCGSYRQTLTLLTILSIADRNAFRDVFESELNGLTDDYISNSTSITTASHLENIDQDEAADGSNGIETTILFSICYEQPTSSTRKVATYPAEFEAYISVEVNREALEEQLMSAGTQILPGSLSTAVLVPPSANRSNTGAIAGASSGAVLAVLALGLLLLFFKKTRKAGNALANDRQQSLPSSTASPSPEEDDTTKPDSMHATQMAVPATTGDSSAPLATAIIQDGASTPHDARRQDGGVFYKDQGDVVPGETTIHPQPWARNPPPTDNDWH